MKCAKTLIEILSIVLIFALLSGCVRSRPEVFPDNDIVYQSSDDNNASIGFVNADGSNNIVLPLDFYPVRPTWSADGKTLYFLNILGDSDIMQSNGYISFWQEGNPVSTCWKRDWRNVAFVMPAHTSDPQQVIMFYDSALIRADLKPCRELERYMEIRTSTANLYSAFLSQDGQLISFTKASDVHSGERSFSYTNYVLNISTSKITELGEGTNPAISPDNQWVAYTTYDGIYLIATDGSQKRRLVEYNFEDSLLSHFAVAPPAPRWSPDGQWLIYHKCVKQYPHNCYHADEFSIFKVEVATGQEIKIIDGGVYPYWRWREDTP